MKLKIAQLRTSNSPVSYPKGVRRSLRISNSSPPSLEHKKQQSADLVSDSSLLDTNFIIFTPLSTASSFPDVSCSEQVSSYCRRRKTKPEKTNGSAQKGAANIFSLERREDLWQVSSLSSGSPVGVHSDGRNSIENLYQEKQILMDTNNCQDNSTYAVEGFVLRRTCSCTTIGRKRVVVMDETSSHSEVFPDCNTPSSSLNSFECTPRKRFASPRTPSSCLDRLSNTPNGVLAPKTPYANSCHLSLVPSSPDDSEYGGDSLLELLPLDLLLRIVCCLRHDDLKPVAHVCKRMRKAVVLARRFHFSFTTPHRERNGKTSQLFPCNEEQPGSQGKLSESFIRPPTPNAPRHVSKPAESRLSQIDTRPFAPPLFQQDQQEAVLIPNNKHFTKPKRNLVMASHRVLFNEDELCQAVAQNTL